MRKLIFALALCLIPTIAFAQNTTCSNRPAGDSSNACANTRFVQAHVPPSTGAGGTNGQIQYNNAGAFGGFTPGGDLSFANPNFTVNKINGIPVNPINSNNGDVLQYNGTSYLHQAMATALNLACQVAQSTCVSMFGYANPTWWGAASGGSPATNSSAIASAITASTQILLPPGTYQIASPIAVKPNTQFNCQKGATITQANGANLTQLFDFATNVPNKAELRGCVVDGNSANNPLTTMLLVNVNASDSVIIQDNIFTNSYNNGVQFTDTTNSVIRYNHFSNIYSQAIIDIGTLSGNIQNNIIADNILIGSSFHLIHLEQVSGDTVSGNILYQGIALGGAQSAMQVSISGSTVTWVSGTNFAGVHREDILVVNGGQEFHIVSVNSNTSLTISGSATLTNVPASIGGGDVLSLSNVSYTRATNNYVFGGVTGGIVLSQVCGIIACTQTASDNIISNNTVIDSGTVGIDVETGVMPGNPFISQTSILNNFIESPGRAGTASSLIAGIYLKVAGEPIVGVLIDGNYVSDLFALSGGYWLAGSGATKVAIGTNNINGFANGQNSVGYPIFASLPAIPGYASGIIDGNAAGCADSTCTTWATNVTSGGGALKIRIWYDGVNWTLVGK